MIPNICHIYGPLYLNNYGLCIFIGILIFMYCAQRHWLRKKYISKEQFANLVVWGTLVGIMGGRLLFVITDWNHIQDIREIFKIWEGGFSVLGTIIAVTLFLPLYLHRNHIPIFPIIDLAGIYGPLLMGISRFGCFFAGCCHGLPTSALWGITYTHRDSMAPLFVKIHPTQIYSALSLLGIFLIMRYIMQPMLRKPGQLFGMFLMLIAADRFTWEFFRGDVEYVGPSSLHYFSLQQWISLSVFVTGFILLIYRSRSTKDLYYPYEPI